VRVRTASRTQHEKFLFYRGVGTFALPVLARRDGDRVVVEVVGADPVDRVLVFERHGDAVGHRDAAVVPGETSIESPALTAGTTGAFESVIRSLLVGAGLFEREAQAMIDTWRDTWSQDGLRVFYLVPRALTDAVLPLTIDPAPSALVRVLVGRADVLGQGEPL
jgi:hypothetical protein